MEIKTLTGKRIDIKKGEKAIIELNNSLFNDSGTFVGSYSYPVRLALTPETLEAIDFAPELEKKIRNPLIPVIVYLEGQVFKKSVLSLSVNNGNVEGTLQIDLRILNDLIKGYYLDELPGERLVLSTDENDLVTHMKAAAINTDYRFYPYTFLPVKNPLFVGEVQQVPASAPRLSNSVINEFKIEGGTFSFLKSSGGVATDNTDVDRDLKHKVPFFYLCYVIKETCRLLGYTAKGDFLTHPDVEKIVIDNINEMANATNGDRGTAISLDDHLPHITIEDFFKVIIGFFNIRITLNTMQNEIIFSWKKTALENPQYLDLSEYRYTVLQQNNLESEGYTLKSETEKLASDVAEVLDQVVVGRGKKPIDVKAGTLRLTKEFLTGSTTNTYNVLGSEKQGNLWDQRSRNLRANSVDKSGEKDFPLRFMFTKGTTESVLGVNYPSGAISGSEFNLKFNGSNSLYDFAYKKWLNDTADAKTFRIKILLPITVLKKLIDETILLLKSPNGMSVYGFWQKIKFTSTNNNSVVLSEIDILMINSVVNVQRFDEEGFYCRVKISERIITPTEESAKVVFEVFSNKLCTIPAVDFLLKVETEVLRTQLLYENYGSENQTVTRVQKLELARGFISEGTYSAPRVTLKYIWANGSGKREEYYNEYQFKPRRGYTIIPTIEIP